MISSKVEIGVVAMPWIMPSRIVRLLTSLLLFALLGACDIRFDEAVPRVDEARAVVGGFDISVRLVASHPFLDEHRKEVRVHDGQRQIASVAMIDPGGFATLYVLDDGKRLMVIDGLENGIAIDKTSKLAADVDPASIPDDFISRAAGRFAFDGAPSTYRWIPATTSGH